MATTTNYGWETPDDTDLVKDGAAAIRTLGSSVDTTTKALNPATTLGDIQFRSATANTNTRLGIGTAGQVLTVNSGATAPEWATPGAPATNYTLLSTTTTNTGTSFNITGLSGYNNLLVTFQNVSTNDTGNNQMYLRPNNNTTSSNYQQVGWSMTPPSTMTNVVIAEAGIKVANQGTSTGKNICGYIYLFGANSSGRKMITQATAIANGTGGLGFIGGGDYTDANVISNMTLITLGGSFTGGTMRIFGAN